MSIPSDAVRRLREETGVGIMDCKRALEKSGGDVEKAKKILREEGKAQLAALSSRAATEGRVDAYIHHTGKIGVLVEVDCNTDFTANSDAFREFVQNLAKHIAAASPPPRYIRAEDVPEEILENEKEIYRAQAQKEGKPPEIAEKIVEGRLQKFYQEVCLLKQPHVMDPEGKLTVEDALGELVSKVGENVVIRRFARFEVGR
jgi:elongation factor Ts